MDRYSIISYEDEYGIEPVLEDEYEIEPVKFYFKREFSIFGFSINIEIIRWESVMKKTSRAESLQNSIGGEKDE